MSTDRIIVGAAIGYCMAGMFAALVTADHTPDDARRPAIVFTLGTLWPLTIVGAIGYWVYRGGRLLARSYSALWRAWRGPRLPEARTRRRSP